VVEANARSAGPQVSPLLLSMFGRYCEGYLGRHFHAVRLSRAQRPDPAMARGKPLVLYFNHPSWWDPLICLQMARQLFPDRRHYGPIDARALGKYRFFAKLGFFPVETGTSRGARQFLTASQQVLGQPDAALWIPAAGRFSDPRERPLRLQPAMGHLASRLRQGVFVPVALEYPFWEERFPEALVRFGEEVSVADAGLSGNDWGVVLEERLTAAQEALAAESITRDPGRFEALLGGSAGVGGVYDVWRRFRARLRGEKFSAAHGDEPPGRDEEDL